MRGNLNRFTRKLEDKRDAKRPAELIQKALDALQAVDTDQDSFTEDTRIVDMVFEINRITYEMKKTEDMENVNEKVRHMILALNGDEKRIALELLKGIHFSD